MRCQQCKKNIEKGKSKFAQAKRLCKRCYEIEIGKINPNTYLWINGVKN